jgi:hypothetical protein
MKLTDMPPEVLSRVSSHLSAVDEAIAACSCRVFRDTFVSNRAAIRAELTRVLTVAVHGGSIEEFPSECVRVDGAAWATWAIDGGIPHRRVALCHDTPFVVAPWLGAAVGLGPARFFHVSRDYIRGYAEGADPVYSLRPRATDRGSQHAVKYMYHLCMTLHL